MNLQQVLLKPNRDLIDQDFEGYKLALEPKVPLFKSTLISGINEAKLSDDCYSLQHVKCFTLYNHLHLDSWNQQAVYYVTDELSIYRVKGSRENKFDLEEAKNVFKFPKDTNAIFRIDETLSYNVTIHFISEHLVVLANGFGNLTLLKTGDRLLDSTWKVLFSSSEFGTRRPFLLLDAALKTDTSVDCLLLRVEDKENVSEKLIDGGDDKSAFVSVLDWITLTRNSEEKWEVSRISRLQGIGSIDYAAVDPNHDSLWIASEKRFSFVYDSLKSIESIEVDQENKDVVKRRPVYAWKQTADEAIIWFQMDEKTDKKNVEVKMTSDHISVKLLNSSVLEGQLFAPIDVDSSVWIVDDTNKLEITLEKLNKGLMWRELVKGDINGEEIVDPELLQQIHERLAHLTTDKLNPDPQIQKLGDFNLQQLEECDDFPEHSFSMIVFNRDSLKATHEISLSSHNWLFRCPRTKGELPLLCVRYDVDALLCLPDSQQHNINHVATFNAFGYVSASKRDRKFMCCSPDSTFAVLCDARRHIYVYFQSTPLENDLRNRKTGQKVKAVAKQKLISLDNSDILGLQVTNTSIFVLTRENIYEAKVIE